MARTTSRHRCSPNRPCHTNRKVAAIFQQYYSGGGAPALTLGDSVVEFSGAQANAASISRRLNSPRSWYNNGKTYFIYQGNITEAGGAAQIYAIEYDEKDGIKRPFIIAGPAGLTSGGSPDTHSVPSLGVDSLLGRIYALREETHDTPIPIFRGNDINYVERLAEIINDGDADEPTAQSSYHHLIKLPDGNYMSWCRMTKLFETYSGGHAAWIRSTNGLEGWGDLVRVSTNPRPITSTPVGTEEDQTRHYPTLPMYRYWHNNYLYVHLSQRTDDYSTGQGKWNIYGIMRTKWVGEDGGVDFGYVWENVAGDLYTHDIRDSNYITETILKDEFAVFDVGGDYNVNNGFIPESTVASDGTIYMITGDGTTGALKLRIIKNRTITVKDLNIADYVQQDPATQQGHLVAHMAHLNGYLELVVTIDEGAEDVWHLFRSTDDGDTFEDFGEIAGASFPENYLDIPSNKNFIVVGSYDDGIKAGSRALKIQRVAKGAIQAETPRIVVPAASFDDATGLFRYRFQDGDLTKSGNNISAAVDLFGLRNATGVNNPQWNGSDTVTLNGTNQYFTIPTTGLTALSKLTVFAVARNLNSASDFILCFSDNTAASVFLGLAIFNNATGVNGKPAFTYKGASTPVLTTFGQAQNTDDEYCVITWIIDGQGKVDIVVNGLKQHYEFLNFSTLAHFQTLGKLNFGTVNSIRMGSRDQSGTDSFFNIGIKEMIAYENVFGYEDQRQLEKKMADDHGITLNYGYQ